MTKKIDFSKRPKKLCKRQNCKNSFIPTRTNKLYCDAYCQMRENNTNSQRKRRRKAREIKNEQRNRLQESVLR